MTTYIDFAKYLQMELDKLQPDRYEATRERNNDIDFKKINVVVRELAGNVYSSSANLPVQIDIYTSDAQGQIDFFKEFVRTHNQKIIQSFVPIKYKKKDAQGNEVDADTIKRYDILQTYTTPTVMEADIDNFDNVSMARLSIFANLFVMDNISDIRVVKIDDEEIESMERTLGYSTEIFSSRISGVRLNENNVKSAATVLQMSMINKNSLFVRKVAMIRQGTLSGNTKFNVELELNDGSVEKYLMIIQQATMSSAISKLPSLSVSLVATRPEEV